jgi:hypothetical protein
VEMANWKNTTSTAILTYMSSTLYLEALLRSKYLSLTAFHFHIFGYNFLRSTFLKPGNSLSLHHSFHCLRTSCHPTAKARPTEYGTLCKHFQWFRTS